MQPTDDWPQLIEAACEGCEAAFGEIAIRLEPNLLCVAQSRLAYDVRSKFDAADIVQISFLEARMAMQSFRGSTRAELLAWLRAIVITTTKDEHRRFAGKRQRRITREAELHQKSLIDDVTPCALLQLQESEDDLLRAVNRLSPRLQFVVNARFRDGKDYSQISVQLGVSEGAARKLWSRAAGKLRTWLERTQTSDVQPKIALRSNAEHRVG